MTETTICFFTSPRETVFEGNKNKSEQEENMHKGSLTEVYQITVKYLDQLVTLGHKIIRM